MHRATADLCAIDAAWDRASHTCSEKVSVKYTGLRSVGIKKTSECVSYPVPFFGNGRYLRRILDKSV